MLVQIRMRWLGVWTLVLLSLAPVIETDLSGGQFHAAWADDDDGGDDDGGDDDDDGDDDDANGGNAASGGGQGSAPDSARSDRDRDTASPPARRSKQTRARRQPEAIVRPRPDFAPEIVVTDLSEADLSTLIAEGFSVIERKAITTLAVTLDRLSVPRGLTLDAARDRVRQLPSGGDADFNHFYRTSQSDPVSLSAPPCTHENCSAWHAINWPAENIAAGRCPLTLAIGLIDTGINPDHDILADAQVQLIPRPGAKTPSGAVHGTAIASLLVGSEGSRVPGLLPDAKVMAVDVFARVDGDERADVAALVEGLDLLATRQVRLYNLSLSGPPNTVLSRMLDRLTDEAGLDAVVVSAAGNGGPTAQATWPAAHPQVIAVTAVDTRERLYRQAQRGDHLALAAPGVNLLAATSIKGARAKTGTSFAVPFVTAGAALLMSRPEPQSAAQVRATLAATARDLGEPGRDPMFGHGLLSAAAFCR